MPVKPREDLTEAFLESDAAVKQILLQLNSKRAEWQMFVIEDLDPTHLLIKADEEVSMRQELEVEVRACRRCAQSLMQYRRILVGEEYIRAGQARPVEYSFIVNLLAAS